MKNFINKLLIKTINYRLVNNNYFKHLSFIFKNEPHLEKDFLKICEKLEKIYGRHMIEETNYTAYSIVRNIVKQKIDGCIVECGVYEGQKISFFLETLNLLKINDRDIYVIDTFEGMTEPKDNDVQVVTDAKMKKGEMSVSLDQVKNNIMQSNYPEKKIHFIKMDVRDENKLNNVISSKISLLRLDTDFYDSTLSILKVFHEKVVKNGYIIHDDYGHWKGHYEACKEFYSLKNIEPAMIRTSRKEMVELKY